MALLPSGIQKSREWKRNGNWKRKLEIELKKKKNENTTLDSPLPVLDSAQILNLIWLSRTLANVEREYFADEIV